MRGVKSTIVRGGFETLYFSGLYHVMRPFVGGLGVILTLHHVRPRPPGEFQPNRLLEVTPEFFEDVLQLLRGSRRDLISLDEMHRRLVSGETTRPFACVTFDDGYRDVMRYAYPLLKRYEVPFALYISTSFPDRLGELWWVALEAAIAGSERVSLTMEGRDRVFECATSRDKQQAYDEIYGWLRSLSSETELRRVVRDFAARHGVDMAALCRDDCMDWSELARIAADPLCTIGAHTVNHVMLKKMASERAVRTEMEMSRAVLEAALGVRPQHLAYPVGDPTSAGPREFRIAAELGFRTAVTTRPGVIFGEHRDHLTALPRISVNGDFQSRRYLKVLLSGAATGLWNGFRRVNAA
jgi:peptidoglycan/xylan/chitin deacetylase (PgdA/CDA1 family)